MTLSSSKSLRQVACACRVIATGLLLSIPAVASAQSRAAGDPSRVASINPFIILFGYFSGEFEQRISRTLSVGIAGSSVSYEDDDRRANIDAKVRLYPNERALNGFGLGMSVGWTQLRNRSYEYPLYPGCINDQGYCEPTVSYKTYNAPSIAIEISYQWLLGSQKSTAITMGGGAKRAFTTAEKWGNTERILPTGRLSVGYAF